MAIGKRKRFEIFKRDSFMCQYCGRTPPAVVLQCDHIVPVSKGGTDDNTNLATSCADCNLGKSNIPLDATSRPLMEQAREAREKLRQIKAYNRFLYRAYEWKQHSIKVIGWHWWNGLTDEKNKYVLGRKRVPSISTFLDHLDEVTIVEAMDLAQARVPCEFDDDEGAWRYFCGICWNKIRAKQEGKS